MCVRRCSSRRFVVKNVQWSDDGIRGAPKFLARVYRLVTQWGENRTGLPGSPSETGDETRTRYATQDASDHYQHRRRLRENFRFNTSVAALMEWVNLMYEVSHAFPNGSPPPHCFISPRSPSLHRLRHTWPRTRNEGLANQPYIVSLGRRLIPIWQRNDETTLVVQGQWQSAR